mmetsp:Transcript_45932/g.82720  ORF Transcript_45932/g.82720 Transcript_45932/m.82720 type:complete len:882 (+) Transcript_45932:78-2723(+)
MPDVDPLATDARQGDGDENTLPGTVTVPPLWAGEDGNVRKLAEIPAPPPRKPPPLRNATISPWLLETRPEDVQQAQQDELMVPPDDFNPPSGGGTPRSGVGSLAGSQRSASASSMTSASVPYSMDSRPPLDPDEAEVGGVSLSQLEEFLAVKKGMRNACGTLPLTFAVWITYVFMLLNIGETLGAFQSSNLILQSITQAVAIRPDTAYVAAPPVYGTTTPAPPPPGETTTTTTPLLILGTRTFTMHEIAEVDDIGWWIKTALIPIIDPYGSAMSGTQKMVGFARMVQQKGEFGDCKDLSKGVLAFYPGLCYPQLSPGTVVASFGDHPADDAFTSDPSRPGKFEAWLDAGRDRAVMEARVQNLIDHHWIDAMTQYLDIDGFFINVETSVYSRLNLRITIDREGGITPILHLTPIKAEVITHWSQVFVNLIFVCLLGMQLVIFVQQAVSEYSQNTLHLHFRDVWTWLDLAIIMLAIALLLAAVAYDVASDAFQTAVAQLGDYPTWDTLEAPATRKVQAILENQAFRLNVNELVDGMDYVMTMSIWVRFMSAWYGVALCLRFFRGFSGQPRTAVILQAILYMGNLFMHHMIVFGVVFGNFALSGYILFGEQVHYWSNMGNSVDSLMHMMMGEFDYDELRNVAPWCALIWWWAFFLSTTIVLAKVLTATVVVRFLEVRQALGEPGLGLPAQVIGAVKNLWYSRSYEGSMKSTPDEDLFRMISANGDAAYLKKLMSMKQDRRLRTRDDLAKAEKDVKVDVDFLVQRGMDPSSAERLLERCSQWAGNITVTSSATNRLILLVARQMKYIQDEAERMQRKVRSRIDRAAQSADRVDVKHAKCIALAKRILRAQKVPHGWTVHRDEQGRRYLRHEQSGLTSWTLPRGLV